MMKDGTPVTGTVVNVPADTETFRSVVTLTNAAIDYDLRPVIKLKKTTLLDLLIEEGFRKSNTPAMNVWNSANMKAVQTDTGEEIVSIDDDGFDSLRGYTTDVSVVPQKSSRQTISDVNYETRNITIHYSAKVEERSVINDKKTYLQAIEDGRLIAETSGIWRDLLPKGVTPVLSSVRLRSGDTIKNVYALENYKNSGRTLLVVEADLTVYPERYKSGDMYYWEDVPRIEFDALYDFDSLVDYGKKMHNVISFQSGNDFIGTVEHYSGEPDDPTAGNNIASAGAFANAETDADERAKEIRVMTNLDDTNDNPNFVYAGVYTNIDIISAARTSLFKDIMVNNDGDWDDGLYYEDPENNKKTVYTGGTYVYRLRMMSDTETISKDLILYDSLENFYAGDGNDVIDINAARWQGTLESVDVSQLEDMGCAPVLYYSTVENLLLSDETDPDKANTTNVDLTNTSIWTKASDYQGSLADVKAIAVDASKKKDGTDFSLDPMASVAVLLRMRAPSGEAASTYISQTGVWGDSAQAYNNAYLLCTSIDKNTGDADGDNFVRKDYTKLGLQEYKLDVEKQWDDDNNRDGIRPNSVTVHLLQNGDDTGQTVTLTKEEPIQTFHHLPYTDPEGVPYQYTFSEDPVDGYTSIINKTDNGAIIINAHDPERFTYEGEKRWVDDVEVSESARPDKVTIQLFANGKYVKQMEVGPDENGEWKFAFLNVFRNENGEEIQYTVKEVVPASIYGKMNSYTVSYEGHDVINTYHPRGDLKVIKDVTDTTSVSVNTEFPFTFTFERENEVEGEENIPVFDEFNYDVVDDENTVLRSGTIASNGVINIKGGERIIVHEIPEYVIYSVSEEIPEGFIQTSKAGDTGIIHPNKTAEATFINKYAASGQINLSAIKHLDNRKLNKYQFKYDVYDTSGNVIRSASNTTPDNTVLREDETVEYSTAPVRFGAIKYTEKDAGKTFTYAIQERQDGKSGYQYDYNRYFVKVSVVDNGNGTLSVTPAYYQPCDDCGGSGYYYQSCSLPYSGGMIPAADKKDEIDFTNYVNNMNLENFTSGNEEAGKEAYKAFLDKVLEKGAAYTETFTNAPEPFNYVRTITFNGSDAEVDELFRALFPYLNSNYGSNMSVINQDNGIGSCQIQFNANYTKELSVSGIYVYPKCTTCHGELTQGDPLETLTFNNEYHAEGSVVLRAWKDLQGRQLQNGEFTFELYDEDKNLVDTKTNTEDGSVVFDALNFDEKDIGKTYHYFVKEATGEDETVNYDQNVYGYQIEVLDNGDGTLSFSQGHATPILGAPEFESNPDAARYAVSLYGIGVDRVAAGDVENSTATYDGTSVETEVGGLTFGPALGANYITSYKSHVPSGTTTKGNEHRCIHDDDWTTIIQWNNEDPEVYEQCIAEGCTHSVELTLPDGLKNASFDPKYMTGDGPAMLYKELMLNDSSYENLRWHPNNNRPDDTGNYGTNYEGWGATRIRAMMNGADALTDTGDGTENGDTYSSSASSDINKSASVYTGDNNLLSAFPTELKSAIGARATKYDSVYNQKTEQNLRTSYDRLWLLSPNEIWSTTQNTSTYYTHPLEGTQYQYFAAKTNMAASSSSQVGTRAYYRSSNTSGSGFTDIWWLRSSSSDSINSALYVSSSGYCVSNYAYDYYGVAPCFSLKANAELPEGDILECPITGWETEDAEMPVFRNTLKDGELQVEKYVENESAADPGKKFHFKVVLIGDDVPEGAFDYDYNQSRLGTATITYDGNGGIFEQNGDSTDNAVTYKESIGGGVPDVLEGEYYQPTKEGHTFAGWYEDTEFTIPFDREKFTGEDKTVYAKWEINHYSVKFNTNGGSTIADQDVVWNEKATRPETDPTKSGMTFDGWYKDAELTQEYDFDTPVTENVTLYAKWKTPPVKYAVSLYGIFKDEVAKNDVENSTATYGGDSVETETAGLTFGPALGANYVTSFKSHTPSGTTAHGNEHRCIHNDDWATIIQWNNEDPEVYEQCIAEGCTHSVELELPDGLKNTAFNPSYTTGDGPAMLYRELMLNDSSYENLRWHPNNNMPGDTSNYGTNYEGWGATRIRAMLNGADSITDTGDGTENGDVYSTNASTDINKSASVYTNTNNLLSAFPTELKSAIGARATKYDSVYNQKTEQNLRTSYDRLWLLSPNEIWSTTQNTSTYYKHPLEGTQYPYFAAKTNMAASGSGQVGTRAYYRSSNTSGSGSTNGWWLRSSYSIYTVNALYVGSGGGCYSIYACSYSGVSPCFSLKTTAKPLQPKYAVSLYGIGIDKVATGSVANTNETASGATTVETEDAGLTFGPALGENYVISYKSHTPSGTTAHGNEHRCIHNDDWATIIEWNNEDPEVYEQCISEGCTHSVELDLPAGLKNALFDPKYTTGDGPGALYRELMLNDSSYENLRWHPNNNRPGDTGNYGTNYEGWGATRIRAMLNGADALTDTGDGTENGDVYSLYASSDINKSASVYTGDNNLLSAFPVELKSAIGARVTKYDSVHDQKTEQNLKMSYDKLWLLSPNEIWTTAQNTNSYYMHPLEGTQYPYFAAKTNMAASGSSQVGTRTYYRSSNTSGSGSTYYWWLRSSRSYSTDYALYVNGSGGCSGNGAYSYLGVSPCFSLARNN